MSEPTPIRELGALLAMSQQAGGQPWEADVSPQGYANLLRSESGEFVTYWHQDQSDPINKSIVGTFHGMTIGLSAKVKSGEIEVRIKDSMKYKRAEELTSNA